MTPRTPSKPKTVKAVKAWALENPRMAGDLFSGTRPVRLFHYRYEAQTAADWQKDNEMQPWIPVRVTISISPPQKKGR